MHRCWFRWGSFCGHCDAEHGRFVFLVRIAGRDRYSQPVVTLVLNSASWRPFGEYLVSSHESQWRLFISPVDFKIHGPVSRNYFCKSACAKTDILDYADLLLSLGTPISKRHVGKTSQNFDEDGYLILLSGGMTTTLWPENAVRAYWSGVEQKVDIKKRMYRSYHMVSALARNLSEIWADCSAKDRNGKEASPYGL